MKTIFSLLVATAFTLTGCVFDKHKDQNKEAAEHGPTIRDQSGDQDFQAFLGRLRQAVRAHDANTVASMMVPDFAFVLGATEAEDRKGEGVFKFWDENGLWQELDGILSEKFVPKGDFMVAPPQFADQTLNYNGYRAGIRRVNGSWKFVYFVNG